MQNFEALITSQLVARFLRLCTSVLLLRLLTPSDYGVFTSIMILVSLARRFDDFGISAILLSERSSYYDSVGYWIKIGLSMLISIALIPIAQITYPELPNSSVLTFFGLLPVIFSSVASNSELRALRNSNAAVIVKSETISSIVYCLSALLLAFYGFGFWSLFLALVFKAMTRGMILILEEGVRVSLEFNGFGEIIKRVSVVGISGLIFWGYTNVDNIYIQRFISIEELGIYAVYYQWAMIFPELIQNNLRKHMQILFAKYDHTNVITIYNKIILNNFRYILPVFILIICKRTEIFGMLFSGDWQPINLDLLFTLLLFSLFRCLQIGNASLLLYLRKEKYDLYAVGSVFITSVLIMAIFRPKNIYEVSVIITYIYGTVQLLLFLVLNYKRYLDLNKSFVTVVYYGFGAIMISKIGLVGLILVPFLLYQYYLGIKRVEI